ncbi:hypothetical protein [Paeniglutamicibacter psychrophenolicus]|uniref:hypothetical protein n=1 Tax=Paeniglutamicibacter psychrophenolicus TaxID=257454 RepID=UPI002781D0AB|nr:hypothetical protein [Paeniglutamicibacter psychrophenolicus]MDQ0093064.1 hypothetical protein [Paeniglutamicibacter psychrophenolicus]
MKSDSSELYLTVQEVRERNFPGLDARLVEDLLNIQVNFSADAAEAKKQSDKIINAWAAGRVEKGDLNVDTK